jgi:glucosamine kinase
MPKQYQLSSLNRMATKNGATITDGLPFWYAFGMVSCKRGIAMTLYLGVDGGGSGCRAAVADAAGRVLGQGAAASANIWTDPEGARANILAASEAAVRSAGGRVNDLVAVLGLAGANVAGAAERLASALPFARVRIESDAVVALKGALGDEDGITAAIGTGSVFGAQRDSRVRMSGGWGFQLGDHGSGAVMGRAVCVAALLAHDGEVDRTPLLAGLLAEHGGPEGVVAWGKAAAPRDFARLVPRILEAAAGGDPAAATILAQAEADIARAIDRLMADGPVPVAFLGGLGPVFAERLAGRYRGLVRAPKGSGLDGALMLARRLG